MVTFLAEKLRDRWENEETYLVDGQEEDVKHFPSFL